LTGYVSTLYVDGNNLFASGEYGVMVSTDRGANWIDANTGLGGAPANSFARIGTTLFAGTTGSGIFKSTNNGIGWTKLELNIQNLSHTYVPSLVVSPSTPLGASGSTLTAAINGAGIYRSTDNGTTWTALSTGSPMSGVTALAGGSTLYAGTVEGLYVSTNGGVSWSASGLTNPARWVTSLAVDSANIYAGTYGSGVWRLSTAQNDLLTYYPLNSSATDSTGTTGSMELLNTPYQDGGIYCNGIYEYSTGGCAANTAALPPSIFNSFTVTAQFKALSYPTGNNVNPVIVGGHSYRWIGFYLKSDSTVALMYNQNSTTASTVHYTVGTWHEAKLVYDSSSSTGELYLDGVLACSARFTLVHDTTANDRKFCVTSYHNGATFHGILRELKISSPALIQTGIEDTFASLPGTTQLLQNYPNPFNPVTTISYQLSGSGHVTLKVYDMLGRETATLVDRRQPTGVYSVQFNAEHLSSGVYYYRLNAGGVVKTGRMALVK
jgi:hypothetical protein